MQSVKREEKEGPWRCGGNGTAICRVSIVSWRERDGHLQGINRLMHRYYAQNCIVNPLCPRAVFSVKVEMPIRDSLSFKQLSMAFIETCLKNA
jgi:hypothetical protein